MAISQSNAINEIAWALGNNSSRVLLDKASLANQVAGRFCSLWRATGLPAQGAIPAAAAVPTNATLGAIGFTQQTAPVTSYLALLGSVSSNNVSTLEIHDRIAHSGGNVLNVTTAQTAANLDLLTLAPAAARVGEANYSDCQWWLEVYSDGGATASNASINVTFHDASTATLSVQAVGGTIRTGHLFPLTPLIPAAHQGKFIRAVTNVTLSASTGTAGNFGFTVTRVRAQCFMPLANALPSDVGDWAALGLPEVPNGSCLFPVILPTTTSSGTLRGTGKIIHV